MIHIHTNEYSEQYAEAESKQSQHVSKITLRDYQQEAHEAVLRDLKTHDRVMVDMATGLGKTSLSAKIIEDWEGRVMFLVHLEELLQNGRDSILAMTHEDVGIERANEHWQGQRVCCAMVQSISTKLRRFSKNDFSLIICDEAHHSHANQYKKVFDYFNCKVIGVTATPRRADNAPLPYEKRSYRMGIEAGVDQGYLVPIRGERVLIDEIDLQRVTINSAGNFDEEELDMEMVKGAAAIADVIHEKWGFDKGILFFPGCASARLVNDFLNKKQEGLSVYIDGKITGDVRRGLINKLRSGDANWLCNVGIATEGFDWPDAAVVGMCAPTLSQAGYIQRAGRGTRPIKGILNGLHTKEERIKAIADSGKPFMTILDFVGNSENLSLISSDSLLEVMDYDPTEAGEKKRKEQQELEEQNALKQHPSYNAIANAIKSTTVHQSEKFCPFTADGDQFDKVIDLKQQAPEQSDTISEKQYNILARYGIEDWKIPKAKAGRMMGIIFKNNFRLTNSQRKQLRDIYEDRI